MLSKLTPGSQRDGLHSYQQHTTHIEQGGSSGREERTTALGRLFILTEEDQRDEGRSDFSPHP